MPELAEVRERDLWRCVRCGSGTGLHVHHRRMRSQGGRDTFSNMVTVCVACHAWVHQNVAAAQLAGLLVPHGGEPAAIPLWHHAWPAGPILLRDDSTVGLVIP
jgi:hypothetical protein